MLPLIGPLREARRPAQVPVSQQVLTWLLFPPLLTLIARQVILLAGPARSAAAYQYGTAVTGARGAHYEVYIIAIYLLGFVAAAWHGIWSVLRHNMLVLASLTLAGISVAWSPEPLVTLQMTFHVTLTTLFACYLCSRLKTEDLMALLMFMGVATASLSLLFVVALPSYGVFASYAGGAWQGICDHKNTLAISMAYLLTPAFFIQRYTRGQKLLYGVFLLFMIAMSQARGPWVGTLVMLLFVAWLHLVRRARGREARLLVVLTLAFTVAAVVVGTANVGTIARLLGKDPSISGRTGIYVEVWRSLLKKPLFGYGFGTFWSHNSPEANRIREAIGWPNIGYSESGILEVALQTGFVGAGLIILMLGQAFVQAIRLVRSPLYTPRVGWFLTMLVFAMTTNIDDGWFMDSTCIDWVLILVACIGLNREFRRARMVSYGGPHTVALSDMAVS